MQSILIWLRLFLQGAQKRKPPAQDAGGLPSIMIRILAAMRQTSSKTLSSPYKKSAYLRAVTIAGDAVGAIASARLASMKVLLQ